jgi:hypothetical protein
MYDYNRTAAGKEKYEILLPGNKKSKAYGSVEEAAVAAIKQLASKGRGDLSIQWTGSSGQTEMYEVSFSRTV